MLIASADEKSDFDFQLGQIKDLKISISASMLPTLIVCHYHLIKNQFVPV
jgi:hypothetical protein